MVEQQCEMDCVVGEMQGWWFGAIELETSWHARVSGSARIVADVNKIKTGMVRRIIGTSADSRSCLRKDVSPQG